jgi:hypothetical protein
MVSHDLVPQVDDVPATISKVLLTERLPRWSRRSRVGGCRWSGCRVPAEPRHRCRRHPPDLVLLSDDLTVEAVYLAGRLARS